MKRTVILVDEDNQPLGTAEIVEAHTGEGMLHRAFSIYVFRSMGKEILIQRRSDKKMLWPGFWANTCCSHPKIGETADQAGMRRLEEELGFTCELKPVCSFVYRAEDPEGRGVEHEYVTVLLGLVGNDVVIEPDPDEVSEYRWVNVEELRDEMRETPTDFAPWFHLGLNAIRETIA